jgi:hypothetical protein
MNADLNRIDLSKLKHWQVMDPAPEIIQLIDDPILVADILKAQIEFKRHALKSEMQALDNYYEKVGKMLNKVTKKGMGK